MGKSAENKSDTEEPLPEDMRRASRRTMLRLIRPLIIVLFLLLLFAVSLNATKGQSYVQPFPLILTISGVVIAFFGAFYDFGAKRYISDLSRQKMTVTEGDVRYINRQQLILTLAFFGVGGAYVLGAFAVYLFL